MINRELVTKKTCFITLQESISVKNHVWFAQEAMEIIRDGVDTVVINKNHVTCSDYKGLRTIYKIAKIMKRKNIGLVFMS